MGENGSHPDVYQHPHFVFNSTTFQLESEGGEVELSEIPGELLTVLAKKPNHLQSQVALALDVFYPNAHFRESDIKLADIRKIDHSFLRLKKEFPAPIELVDTFLKSKKHRGKVLIDRLKPIPAVDLYAGIPEYVGLRCEFLPSLCVVMVEGEEIDLTSKETELLQTFVDYRKRILPVSSFSNVFGELYDGQTLRTHLSSIRGKIGDSSEKVIETVRGRGYRFNAKSPSSS